MTPENEAEFNRLCKAAWEELFIQMRADDDLFWKGVIEGTATEPRKFLGLKPVVAK